MKVSDPAQAKVFLINILFGAACIIIYDVFRAVRRVGGRNRVYVNLLDIIYFISLFFIIFFAGVKFNFGALRYYQVMGLLSGAMLQIALLSRFEVKLFEIVIKLIIKFSKVMIRVLLFVPISIIRLTVPLLYLFETKTVNLCDNLAKRIRNRGRKKQKNKKIIKKRVKML